MVAGVPHSLSMQELRQIPSMFFNKELLGIDSHGVDGDEPMLGNLLYLMQDVPVPDRNNWVRGCFAHTKIPTLYVRQCGGARFEAMQAEYLGAVVLDDVDFFDKDSPLTKGDRLKNVVVQSGPLADVSINIFAKCERGGYRLARNLKLNRVHLTFNFYRDFL